MFKWKGEQSHLKRRQKAWNLENKKKYTENDKQEIKMYFFSSLFSQVASLFVSISYLDLVHFYLRTNKFQEQITHPYLKKVGEITKWSYLAFFLFFLYFVFMRRIIFGKKKQLNTMLKHDKVKFFVKLKYRCTCVCLCARTLYT